jgi:hypothetical protein
VEQNHEDAVRGAASGGKNGENGETANGEKSLEALESS